MDVFRYFERAKSSKGPIKVADGISWDAIFCMRDILRELPALYLHKKSLSDQEFIEIIRSSYARRKDLELTFYRRRKIRDFQSLYWKLLKLVAQKQKKSYVEILVDVAMRSSVINKYDRVTGDSITKVVDKILAKRKKMSPKEIYKVLKDFTKYQDLNPERHSSGQG